MMHDDESYVRNSIPIMQREGLEVTWPPTDEPWGVREMHVRHPDGHTFRIGRGSGG